MIAEGMQPVQPYEWWKARNSSVLHARRVLRVASGEARTEPMCERTGLQWTAESKEAPRKDRCGYCTVKIQRLQDQVNPAKK